MKKSIIKQVKKANIVFNEVEIQEILNGMTEEEVNDKGKLGIAHYKVLVRITKRKMYEELALSKEDIISDYFIWGPMAFSNINSMTAGGVMFYRIIITKNILYAFGYDDWFRTIERHKKEINQVDKINQGRVGGFIPRDGIIIKFMDRTKIILLGITNDTKVTLYNIIEDLRTLKPDIVNENIFLEDYEKYKE